MIKNEYESTSYDYVLKDGKETVRIDIRWTVEAPDTLTSLIALREKVEALIFRERLRLETEPTELDYWDGDETDKIQH